MLKWLQLALLYFPNYFAFQIKKYIQEYDPCKTPRLCSSSSPEVPAPRPRAQSQGCQAGSMRHRLSRLLAAATRVLTLLSPPSNWARLWRRVMMAVTAFWTNDTSCWESMFSGCPAGDSGTDVSSCVFLCHAMISSRRTAFRMPSTYRRQSFVSESYNWTQTGLCSYLQCLFGTRVFTRFKASLCLTGWLLCVCGFMCFLVTSFFFDHK